MRSIEKDLRKIYAQECAEVKKPHLNIDMVDIWKVFIQNRYVYIFFNLDYPLKEGFWALLLTHRCAAYVQKVYCATFFMSVFKDFAFSHMFYDSVCKTSRVDDWTDTPWVKSSAKCDI